MFFARFTGSGPYSLDCGASLVLSIVVFIDFQASLRFWMRRSRPFTTGQFIGALFQQGVSCSRLRN